MPRTKKTKAAAPRRSPRLVRTGTRSQKSNSTFWTDAQAGVRTNQSAISLVLGVLIIVVLGFSIFNFIKGGQNGSQNNNLIPAQQTHQTAQASTTPAPAPDATKNNLPGKYTVKVGDTLFLIAQKYYGNGYQYSELAKANNISNVDNITVGQVLNIPKMQIAQASPQASPSSAPQTLTQNSAQSTQYVQGGTGGSESETEWGSKITGTTYTVQEGDWLSKIAGRAYGDIYQYQKLAQVNHIANPDVIEPGTVIQIPR